MSLPWSALSCGATRWSSAVGKCCRLPPGLPGLDGVMAAAVWGRLTESALKLLSPMFKAREAENVTLDDTVLSVGHVDIAAAKVRGSIGRVQRCHSQTCDALLPPFLGCHGAFVFLGGFGSLLFIFRIGGKE